MHSFSQCESFSTAREDSMCPRVSWMSEHSFLSVSRSSMPKRTPSKPVSVMLRSEGGVKGGVRVGVTASRCTKNSTSATSRRTYCGVLAVSCPLCQAHGVLADLRSFSLSELSQTGHGGTPQQQMGAGQVDLRRTGQRGLRSSRDTAAVVLSRSVCGLTQRQGTRLDRLTWRGANMCSCWRHEMAAACTRESEWSCIMAQPTRQDERMVEIVAPFPASQWSVLKEGPVEH